MQFIPILLEKPNQKKMAQETFDSLVEGTDKLTNSAKPPKFVVIFDDENRVERYAYLVKATSAANVPTASVTSTANTGAY